MSVFAERVAQRRKELHFTQEEFAGKIGTSQRQVSKYETGRNDPSGEVIAAMATVLETTTDWLLGIAKSPDRFLRGEDDLTDDEFELIRVYRQKTPDQRRQAIEVLKVL